MLTSNMRTVLFVSCLLLSLTFSTCSESAHAATASSLLATAIHNTDTVKTLQYSDQIVEHFSNGTLTNVVQGQEDEVRNREQDHQTLVERVKNAKGKTVMAAYAVNIVFLNGETYYERPLTKDKTWHTKKGMSFKDGIASFKRGRTTVSYVAPFTNVHPVPAGAAPNGQARFQARVSKGGLTGTMQVFVSRGTTPYVTAVTYFVTKHANGKTVTVQSRMVYGPFNRSLNIAAPISST